MVLFSNPTGGRGGSIQARWTAETNNITTPKDKKNYYRMSSAITVRQQLALRPGSLYGTEPRSLAFGLGSLFSFPLHSTAYEADAATVRIPAGIKLRLTSASVDRKEMADFLRNTGKAANGGVSLRFSSEENGDMIPVCTFDGERSGELSQTGLGIEGVLRLRRFFVDIYFCVYRWHSLC